MKNDTNYEEKREEEINSDTHYLGKCTRCDIGYVFSYYEENGYEHYHGCTVCEYKENYGSGKL